MPEPHKVFCRFLELVDGYRKFFGGGTYDLGAVIKSVEKSNFLDPGKKVKF